jgi:hypothetical protein
VTSRIVVSSAKFISVPSPVIESVQNTKEEP